MKNFVPSDLGALSRSDLVTLWQKHHRSDPPKQISRGMLLGMLAFDLQIARNKTARQEWARLQTTIKRETGKTPQRAVRVRKRTARSPKPGAILVREWNGTLHRVAVLERGYAWRGETWRSLSAIAEAITGTHWSGPRFFGLTDHC